MHVWIMFHKTVMRHIQKLHFDSSLGSKAKINIVIVVSRRHIRRNKYKCMSHSSIASHDELKWYKLFLIFAHKTLIIFFWANFVSLWIISCNKFHILWENCSWILIECIFSSSINLCYLRMSEKYANCIEIN